MSREKEIKVTGSDDQAEKEKQPETQSDIVTNTETTPKEAQLPPEPEEQIELSEEEKLKVQVEELDARLLRTLADFDNFRKRTARRHEELIQSANDRLISELLEVMDNFERALQHVEEDNNSEAIRKGTKLIYTQMKDLLDKYQVQPIEVVGKPFDPLLHEALMQIESEEYDEGIVALEMTRGYRIGDRVLRHSKVGVSRGAGADSEARDKNQERDEDTDQVS